MRRFLLLITLNGDEIMKNSEISLWVSFGSYIIFFLGIQSINPEPEIY